MKTKDFKKIGNIKNIYNIQYLTITETNADIKKIFYTLRLFTPEFIYDIKFLNLQLKADFNFKARKEDITQILNIELYQTKENKNNFLAILTINQYGIVEHIIKIELTNYHVGKKSGLEIVKKKNKIYNKERKEAMIKFKLLEKEIIKEIKKSSYITIEKNSREIIISEKYQGIQFKLLENNLLRISTTEAPYERVIIDKNNQEIKDFIEKNDSERLKNIINTAYKLFF